MTALEDIMQVLDEQIQLLQQKLCVLQRMRQCVVSGDLPGLDELLRDEASLKVANEGLEQRSAQMRLQIASLMGLPPDQVTLKGLVESLDGPLSIALSDRRERLVTILQALQSESSVLAQLVRHTVELNSRVLAALGGVEFEVETYSRRGAVRRGNDVAMFPQSV